MNEGFTIAFFKFATTILFLNLERTIFQTAAIKIVKIVLISRFVSHLQNGRISVFLSRLTINSYLKFIYKWSVVLLYILKPMAWP